jgi:hypothetical protein
MYTQNLTFSWPWFGVGSGSGLDRIRNDLKGRIYPFENRRISLFDHPAAGFLFILRDVWIRTRRSVRAVTRTLPTWPQMMEKMNIVSQVSSRMSNSFILKFKEAVLC